MPRVKNDFWISPCNILWRLPRSTPVSFSKPDDKKFLKRSYSATQCRLSLEGLLLCLLQKWRFYARLFSCHEWKEQRGLLLKLWRTRERHPPPFFFFWKEKKKLRCEVITKPQSFWKERSDLVVSVLPACIDVCLIVWWPFAKPDKVKIVETFRLFLN